MADWRRHIHTTFVLGAGFSCAAGLPLGPELFTLVRQRATSDGWEALEEDIARYLEYRGRTQPGDDDPADVDLERLMAFLDVEHFLGLAGNDEWSEEGNRGQLAVRNLVAEVLMRKQKEITGGQRQLYLEFAKRLDPTDTVYTFNYDTLLEDCLDELGKRYWLCPDRYALARSDLEPGDPARYEVSVLKLHGSIDWFSVEPYLRRLRFAKSQPMFWPPAGSIFHNPTGLGLDRIIGRSHPDDGGFGDVYRLANLEAYFARDLYNSNAPLMVPPSFNKLLYLGPLLELWRAFGCGSRFCPAVAVIGYSLPDHDEYARQALYQLITGFQSCDESPAGGRKPNLKMVDLRRTDAERQQYRDAFRFVDWDRTDCHFEGFGPGAIEFLFGS